VQFVGKNVCSKIVLTNKHGFFSVNFSELLQKYSITQQTTVSEVCRYFRFDYNINKYGHLEVKVVCRNGFETSEEIWLDDG
jgi:hypothetical protein